MECILFTFPFLSICQRNYLWFFSILKPHDGHAGGWTQFSETTCKNNFIYGVAIEIYPKDGTFTDSRGATNLRMVCADENVMEVSNNDKK